MQSERSFESALPNKTVKGERSRARIVELAAEAFADKGYEGISLNDVIQQSGLTKGAFYYHFPSKEALAFSVFRTKQADLVGRIRSEAGAQPNAVKQLEEMIRARARLLADEPAFRGYLKLASSLVAIYGPGSEFAQSYGVATGVFKDFVHRGQRENLVPAAVEPMAAATFVFGALLGADELSQAASGGQDLVERTEALIPFILTGLGVQRKLDEAPEPYES